MKEPTHRVVIVGGGFAGLHAALALRKAPVQVTLLDRRNFHLFQPLLYQVATGGLSPSNIASPLRSILRNHKNVEVLLAEVEEFVPDERRLVMVHGDIHYDTLIVAAGASHSYFGHDEWAPLAPGLKTVEHATEIRRRILMAFEAAERTDDPEDRNRWLTFVVVGGGPTGVELMGALAEIARHSLCHDFRHINPQHAKLCLIEGSPRVLHQFDESLSQRAQQALERLGVEVITHATVTDIEPDRVTYRHEDQDHTIETRCVFWGAGVQASPLAAKLAAATGAETDRPGRIVVGLDLSVPGHPEIFALGDMAHCEQDGHPLPGVAQVAIQQGKYVARLITARLAGRSLPAFRYHDLGSMATIGRGMAVVEFGKWKRAGLLAWFMWLFVHLMKLVGFRNRVLVFMQWAWSYMTWNLSSRLITGEHLLPFDRDAADEPVEPVASAAGDGPK